MNFCMIYMCFDTVSLNSSVSKPTSFEVVYVLQGHVFWLFSLQNSIQNIHDFSFLNLPLPVVIFGLGSKLLCISTHLSERDFFNSFKALISAMIGRCLCSFPPPPPSLLVAGQFLDLPQLLLAVATKPAQLRGWAPALPFPQKTSITGPKSWCIMHCLCLQI